MVSNKFITMFMKSISQYGCEITKISLEGPVPSYYIKVYESKMMQDYTLVDTLDCVYGLLWLLTYGKLDSTNKDFKIDLKYEVIK